MYRSKILPAAVAALFALGTAGTALAETGEHENDQEIATVLAAKTSVAQAIAAAERQTGSRALKIHIEKENGAYLYEIKTVSKDKVTEVFVDLDSGQVVRTDDEGLFARIFDQDDQKEFAKLLDSSTTLAAAIATAEQHADGKAIEASFDNENGAALFEVEVAKDKAVHKVTIDGASGKVLKVATAEEGEHDED